MSKEQEILAAARARKIKAENNRGIGDQVSRGVQMLGRGFMPTATGAMVGGALAGPPGALVGSMALPIMDTTAMGYNWAANNLPLLEPMQLPSTTVRGWMDKIAPTPETPLERGLELGGQALAQTGGQINALQNLALTAKTQGGRNVATTLSQAPRTQLAVSIPAATASSMVTEYTENPVLGLLTGVFVGGTGSLMQQRRPIDLSASRNAMKDQASSLYKASDEAGLGLKPQAVDGLIDKMYAQIYSFGYDDTVMPGISAVLRKLESSRGQPITLKELDTIRRLTRHASASSTQNLPQAQLGGDLIDTIDDFIDGISPDRMNYGDTNSVGMLQKARSLWHTQKKMEVLEEMVEKAAQNSSRRYSQAGYNHALGLELKKLSQNKKRFSIFNTEEKQAIKDMVIGGVTENFLRGVAKMNPKSPINAAANMFIGESVGSMVGIPPGATTATMMLGGNIADHVAQGIQASAFDAVQNRLLQGMPKNIPGTLTQDILRSGGRGGVSSLPGLLNEN